MSAVQADTEVFAAQRRANRIGILWMIVGMTFFIGNDALVKVVLARVPAAQMIVVRGVMALTLITFVAWRMGALVRVSELFRGWVGVRAGCEGVATFLYLAALYHLPLANATAIQMSAPLFIAVLARFFLGERVDARRWIAIGLGFSGVLMVIQPQADGFNLYAWLCLLATLIYAGRDLLTRKIPVGVPSIVVTLATAGAVVGMAVVVLVAQGWTPMLWSDVGLLALAAVCLSTGYHSVIAAVRYSEVSVVAPFRYTGLLWAVVIGFLVWGDVPNLLAWTGIALLIGAGLYMIHQQRAPRR
ncbi:MAG: DMT family transporter [Pseudomonadota bacterium]|jgi:drug/metabolite transporter (DMT)-like permease|nr:DMT family transporter [Pseudomonadota bacterium]